MKPENLKVLTQVQTTLYGGMHRQMDRMDKLYRQEYGGLLPILKEREMIHRSSRPTTLVDELADQIRTSEPVVDAMVFGSTQAAQEKATLQREWGQNQMEILLERGSMQAFQQFKRDLVGLGGAGLKITVPHHALTLIEQRRGEPHDEFMVRKERSENMQGRESPFFVSALDPRTLYPSFSTDRLSWMIERHMRTAQYMWDNYPEWHSKIVVDGKITKDKLDNPSRLVDWIEYWSWEYDFERDEWGGWYIIEVDNVRIKEEVNPYECVPYVWRYGGLGRKTPGAMPEDLTQTVLQMVSGDLEAMIEVMTAMRLSYMLSVFPKVMVKGKKAKDTAAAMSQGPAAVVELPDTPNSVLKFMEHPQPNQTQLQFLNKIENDIDRKVNPALSGGQVGDSGVHQSITTGMALKVIGPIRDQINGAGSELINKFALIARSLDISSTLQGVQGKTRDREVKPADLTPIHLTSKFLATDPTEDQRAMLGALPVRRDEDMSADTFRRKFMTFLDDPDEEQAKIDEEKMMNRAWELGLFDEDVAAAVQRSRQDEEQAGQVATSRSEMGAVARGGVQEPSMIDAMLGPGVQTAAQNAEREGSREAG